MNHCNFEHEVFSCKIWAFELKWQSNGVGIPQISLRCFNAKISLRDGFLKKKNYSQPYSNETSMIQVTHSKIAVSKNYTLNFKTEQEQRAHMALVTR